MGAKREPEQLFGGAMTQSFQPSEEARKWAAKNFAVPLCPVASLIAHQLSGFETLGKIVCLSQVGPETQFFDDLEFDGLDVAEFLIDLEEILGFEIPDDVLKNERITNVRELVIAVYKLTEAAESR